MKLWLSSSLVTDLGPGRVELLKNKATFSNFSLPPVGALLPKLRSCSAFTSDELQFQASVSLAGRLFYTWLCPSEVIFIGWYDETPKPLDHYTSQELQKSKIQRNKQTKKIDVGVSSR